MLLYIYAERNGISLPAQNGKLVSVDELYPQLTLNYFGKIGAIAFLTGVTASTFASIYSCIAALTTSFSYDFMNIENHPSGVKRKIKNGVLPGVNVVMFLIVLTFWNSKGAIINTIYKVAGYTYGPLPGLYLTALFSRIRLRERWIPAACLSAVLLTWLLNGLFIRVFNFDFGFMSIFVNALLTILFLYTIKSGYSGSTANSEIMAFK